MSFLATAGLLNFLTCLSLGVIVLLNRPKEPLNRVYFAFNVAAAFYSLGYCLWQMSVSQSSAMFWFKWLMLGNIMIHGMYLPFVFTLLGNYEEHKWEIFSVAAANIASAVFNQTGFFYDRLEPRFGLGYWPIIKFSFHLYLAFWLVTVLYAFGWLIQGLRRFDGAKRRQIKLITVACGIGFFGGATNWLMFYGIRVPPYPSIFISFYVALVAFAIIRYRLLDFTLLMRWGAAYSLLVLSLAAVAIPIVWSGETVIRQLRPGTGGYFSLLLACAAVFIIEPLKIRINRFVDLIIFKSPDFQGILAGIEEALATPSDIDDLSIKIGDRLKSIWGTDHIGFAVWNYQSASFDLFPQMAFAGKSITRLSARLSRTDFLVRTLETERRLFNYGIVVEDELTALGNHSLAGERITFWKIRRTMRWLGASACVPMMKGNDLVGFIVLGHKKNSTTYTSEDKKFLSHLSSMITSVFDFQSNLIPLAANQ